MIPSAKSVIKIVSIVFFIIGIISNTLSIIICLRKQLRKIPTFIFKIFNSFMNIITLTTIFLILFIETFDFEIKTKILEFLIFLIFSATQSSAYLQVN